MHASGTDSPARRRCVASASFGAEHPGRLRRRRAKPASRWLPSCARGVDLSFTPVLDLRLRCQHGDSGDRGFDRDPRATVALAEAFAEGPKPACWLRRQALPGHGYVTADSHTEVPDRRARFESIWLADIQPYRACVGGRLSG